MTTDQKIAASVVFTKPDKTPGAVDGIPVWTVNPATVAEIINLSADGLSCEISALTVGSATVTVDGDADLGAGVTDVTASADFSVTDVQVTGASITLGTPVSKAA